MGGEQDSNFLSQEEAGVIENDDLGITYYWEHLGPVSDKEYRKKWELKREWYIKQGILPIKDGNLPDSDKVLVTTQDNLYNPMGGIDSREVEKIISLIKS